MPIRYTLLPPLSPSLIRLETWYTCSTLINFLFLESHGTAAELTLILLPSDKRALKLKWNESRSVVLDSATPWTVHGILQARILEWVAFPFSRGSSQPRVRTQVSHIAGRFFTDWATREAQKLWHNYLKNNWRLYVGQLPFFLFFFPSVLNMSRYFWIHS